MLAVLRLGHRPERDKRITTHVALTARAFGVEKVFVTTKDAELEERLKDVGARFGNSFKVKTGISWKHVVSSWNGTVVHLTMYGERMNTALHRIPKDNLLIVVGAEKVPKGIYERADYNISIGNQPHSEVAALAVFLYALRDGRDLYAPRNGRMRIIPHPKGKVVLVGRLPSRDACIDMLREEGCSREVIEHTLAVERLALEIADLCNADREVVSVGALLHDIGRSRTHGTMHAVEGAKIARQRRLPECIISIIEKHMGAGISKEEALRIGLPPKDYIPETLEEKIVAHADNLISGNRRQPLSELLRRFDELGLTEAKTRAIALHKELSILCGVDIDGLVT